MKVKNYHIRKEKQISYLIKVLPTSVANFKSEKNKIPKTLFIITALIRDMKQAGIDYRKTIEEIRLTLIIREGNL